MKFINRILAIALIGLFVSACDKIDENLNNPTEVTPEGAQVDDVYNSVQLSVRNLMSNMWYWPASLTRMTANTSSYDYATASNPNSFNGIWNTTYSGMWADIDVVIALAENIGLDIHAGSAKIMKAYSMMLLVDVFGDIPYSEALQGIGVIAPTADPGADVYAAATALLQEAIAQMAGTSSASPANDNFYAGDAAKWTTLANTLLLRAAITTRLVDGSAGSTITSVVNGGDFIDSASEDWQFNYGTTRENPNSRHPNYNNSYESGDGAYMSNYYMWMLRAEKLDGGGIPVVDPRIRYYFYRQTEDASVQDENTYSCHFSNTPDPASRPSYYADVDPNMPYCIAYPGDGYWGRDHLNSEGIPPDGPIRTIYGLYPFGGQFDDNTFEDQQQSGTTGATGAGIWPMLTSSYVAFMRAEAALTLGTEGGDARPLLESGMRASFSKVVSFEARDAASFSRTVTDRAGNTATIKQLYGASGADVDDYVNFVLAEYDAAASDDERLDIVMKEYYIALWGNGIEAYNMYRRTGKPGNMQPGLETSPGPFMKSFFYPADHEQRNPNVVQKQVTDPVFWDNGSANVY